MKICVYAIAKNEIKFVDRWYNSVKEADYVCVLDTGSTDGTFDKLKELNIITKQKQYDNFRFDTARNDSMELIPTDADICVCIDLDEMFVPGWTKTLKEKWKNTTTQARYRYTWNFNLDGSEGVVFMGEKIHKNSLFKWAHPVHEILTPIKQFKNNIIDIPEIQLNHHADNTKSRSSYLPLLELSVKENPTDDRNMHYLGREYMFHGEYDTAIETLKKHLTLPTSLWNLERSASLRYIANCYKHKKDFTNQEKYLLLATIEDNSSREPYYELGVFYFEQKDYLKSAFAFNEMLQISNRQLNYISSPICWGSLPYDYLSMCYYHLGDFKRAISTIDIAIKLSPDERLIKNREIFIQNLNN
ncbi:MAG: glycosyltransferase [Clostridia bacterium]|nr:glycosyltransferase [Clostridia bacterium]